MKKTRKMFIVLTLLTVILAISTVNAADDNDDNTLTDTSTISDAGSDSISTEQIQNTKSKEKTIKNEENKQIKKEPVTIDGVEYTQVYENQELNENVFVKVAIFNLFRIEENVFINNCTIIGPSEISRTSMVVLGDNYLYVNNSEICTQINNQEQGNVYLNNCINTHLNNSPLSVLVSNKANLTILNSTINSSIDNNGKLVIGDDVVFGDGFGLSGNGELVMNDIGRIVPYLGTLTDNYNLTNITFTGNKTIIGDLTLSNSTIKDAVLNNSGYMTLDNCVITNSVINNNGHVYMLNCSFIDSYRLNMANGISQNYHQLMYGNGVFEIINSTFRNNSIYERTSSNRGNLFTLRNSILNNITYENNHGGMNLFNTTIIDSSFTNNSQYITENTNIPGGVLNVTGNTTIDNCRFINNSVQLTNSLSQGGHGGAIHIGGEANTTITNTLFDTNTLESASTWASSGSGGAIGCNPYNTITGLTIINCTFRNNSADNHATGAFDDGGYQQGSKGASIYIGEASMANITIENNTFTDEFSRSYGSIYINQPNGDVYTTTTVIRNNNFTNIKSDSETLRLNGTATKILENNNYKNCTINDNITLNIPDKTYADETITITGEYKLNHPESYDQDITEQTQFQIFINGELTDTIDALEFNITPTSENIIITVQPTISQTRKSAMITPTTINFALDDITATIGETTQLTAHITATTNGEDMEINPGRIYFKVNGKILRDTTTGRILYADVSDNTATLDYSVPKTWNIDTEIEAVYTGNDELPQRTTNTVNPTITAPETSQPEFTVSDATATAGDEITITVDTKNMDNGKVVLKVNGKTVKAGDGKLYAKTSGETTTFTYTVPKTLKTGDYTIKAVYTSGATKLEADAKLTVE